MYSTQTAYQVRNKGLEDEALVIEYLKSRGNVITTSTREENIYDDIDCYINGTSLSIKAQHSGISYGNIYFELASQYRDTEYCEVTNKIMGTLKHSARLTNHQVNSAIDELVEAGSWDKKWFYTGKAEYYAILQGKELRLYTSKCIKNYVEYYGWQKVRTLSEAVRQRELAAGGRYINTMTAFLDVKLVPCKLFQLK